MDSFDKTVEKAKEIFNTACQKTGEVVNIQKLKIELATLQSKLNKAYALLGEIEYKKIKDTDLEDTAVKVAVAEIKGLLQEVENLRDEIDNLQGKRTCTNCGARVEKDASFCKICGANLNDEKENN